MIATKEATYEYILINPFQKPRQIVDRAKMTESDAAAGNAVYDAIGSVYMWVKK